MDHAIRTAKFANDSLALIVLSLLVLAGCAQDSPFLDLAPDAECGGCYVVNASLTSAGDDVFMGGYFGEVQTGFIRRFDGEAWGTVVVSDRVAPAAGLWAGPDAVYAVARGGIARIGLDPPAIEELDVDGSAVWGSAADDVLVLGENSVQRFDGQRWTQQALEIGGAVALTGTSASDIYALGSSGSIAHFDGESWSELPRGEFVFGDIWATREGELFALAGQDSSRREDTTSAIARYDGERWETLLDAPADALLAIAGSGSDRIYAVGGSRDADGVAHAVVWTFDGETWTRREDKGREVFLWDVTCTAAAKCYAAGTSNTFIALTAASE